MAEELKLAPEMVLKSLFADLRDENRMLKFEDMTAQRLIDRYNVALAQAVLLRSVRVAVEIRNEGPARYRQLFRRLKFHRLVYRVQGSHGRRLHHPDRRAAEPVQCDHQVRPADGAVPAGAAALRRLTGSTPSCAGVPGASRGASTSTRARG